MQAPNTVMRPRARLMMTIGSELISSPSVAILELVKNSYDADASTVLVKLSEEQGQRPTLAVLDDGVGMSRTTVETTWLEPATSYRRRDTSSRSGRRVLGEKGVGRFASAKLGTSLSLTTRAAGSQLETTARIDWTRFEDESLYLDQIHIPVSDRRAQVFSKDGPAAKLWSGALADLGPGESTPVTTHGTLLELTNLRDDWDGKLASDIHRLLQRLISPFTEVDGGEFISGFNIYLQFPARLAEHSGFVGPAEELSKPHYSLRAVVDADGVAAVTMTLRGSEEPSLLSMQLNSEDGQPLICGPFELKLRVFDRDRQSLEALGEGVGARVVREQIDAASGISIYRNGFRVLPYGEPGDDWLQLDQRRINNPSARLSNSQIIGFVRIGRDDNPLLVDQSNREGLVEGRALQDLRFGILQLVSALEGRRYRLRSEARKAERTRGLFERQGLARLRGALDKIPNAQVRRLVESAVTEIEASDAEIREAMSRYQRLATLGALVDQFVHEVAQPLAALRTATRVGIETIEDRANEPCEVTLDAVLDELGTVSRQSGVINQILNRFRPFGGRRRGRPHMITVEGAVADAVRILRPEIERVGANVAVPDSKTSVTVDHTELQEIVLNLLGNSLYWVGRQATGEPRDVSITVRRNRDQSVTIQVSDSGPGVPEDIRDRIFDPYFTSKPGGYGLGLAIAREIVTEYYGGRIRLLDEGPLRGATFEVNLRRRVGPS